jgi:hypothetical protein
MKQIVLLVWSLALAACASEAAPDGAMDPEANSLSFYDCRGGSADEPLARLEVGLSASTLTITDLSKDAMTPDSGRIDPSFRPTAAFAGTVRYVGFPKIHEEFSVTDVSNFTIVVSKELQTKSPTGKLFVRTSGGEGGDSTSYFCRAKAAPLKVDAARTARLACNLDKLMCVHDNPPGDRCLDELFVHQTSAGEATLRQTFLDHFGVNVVERKVPLGASKTLSRTTAKIAGSWNDGVSLSLDHRGGITYVGTYQHADGRKEKVKCNDLAMLD